jgi:hypothetical protein
MYDFSVNVSSLVQGCLIYCLCTTSVGCASDCTHLMHSKRVLRAQNSHHHATHEQPKGPEEAFNARRFIRGLDVSQQALQKVGCRKIEAVMYELDAAGKHPHASKGFEKPFSD